MEINDVRNVIAANFEDEVSFLGDLVRIDSSKRDAAPGAPFGEGVKRAYDAVLAKAEELGFETMDIDGYGGHIGFGEGEKVLGIPVHLDVVPAGGGWTKGPFDAEIDNGRMYGRGTSDDKGPAVATLFALKALKDLGAEPRMNIRVILGLDEETGSAGMKYYKDRAEEPDAGWTPDAYFPAIKGEMGNMFFDIAKKFPKAGSEGLQLRSIKGGYAPNMVPDSARAVLRAENTEIYEDIRGLIAEKRVDGVTKLTAKKIGRNLEITAEGKTAHGSTPWEGVNAISVLMSFLGELELSNEGAADVVRFYNKCIGTETDGRSLGCDLRDEESGTAVLNAGMIDMDMKELRLTVNVRFPVTCEAEQVYECIMPALGEYDMGVIKGEADDPIYFEDDDPLIRDLMSVYSEVTGDTESRPVVMGGGTYAKEFRHVAAFGALFPGETDRFHCADEFIDLESLKKMTLIFALAMIRTAC